MEVTAGTYYDELVETVDNMKVKDLPRGANDFVDLLAQIYNGGVVSYIDNGYYKGLSSASGFLKSLSDPIIKQLITEMKKLDELIEIYELNSKHNQDPFEDYEDEIDAFEDYLYEHGEGIEKAVLDGLKKEG